MPDHVHLFCSPAPFTEVGVKRWASVWKRVAGEFNPHLKGCLEWDCWDTQMRTRGHYCRKLEYVRHNPVRAGLVMQPEAWLYRGRLNPLWW